MDRRTWTELPAALRRAIQARTGQVLDTSTPTAGRNSAFAAFLHTGDGVVFCKGVPSEARLATFHRHEIRVNAALRHRAGDIPRLLWDIDQDGWLLAGYELVPGEHADLSPGSPDVEPVIDAVSRLALALTPSPLPDLGSLADRYERLAGWQWLADHHPDQLDTWEKDNLNLLIDADQKIRHTLTGRALVHADIHGLNILVADRRARVIDWAWSRNAPVWVDTALLTIRLIAAGHNPADAEQLTSPTWGIQQATPDAVTAFAAATAGQWLRFLVERPSPHRTDAVAGARAWTKHRLT